MPRFFFLLNDFGKGEPASLIQTYHLHYSQRYSPSPCCYTKKISRTYSDQIRVFDQAVVLTEPFLYNSGPRLWPNDNILSHNTGTFLSTVFSTWPLNTNMCSTDKAMFSTWQHVPLYPAVTGQKSARYLAILFMRSQVLEMYVLLVEPARESKTTFTIMRL